MLTAHGRHNKTKTTVGAAVSSAADTQTEARRLLLTSPRGYVQDIRCQKSGFYFTGAGDSPTVIAR